MVGAKAMSGRGTTSRTDNLRQVFYRFDCDGSGWVEANEFLELGEARRKLGDHHHLEHQFQMSTATCRPKEWQLDCGEEPTAHISDGC